MSSSAPTLVLVHGAWGGGWVWRRVLAPLRDAGFEVHTVTLTGDGERAHLRRPDIDLHTHIADVIGLVEMEELENVVLVGHSYGGMVITAVADRIPDRVRSLVYLDALVPRDGESCWDIVNDDERRWYLDLDDSGYGVRPLPFFDPRATPHPVVSFLQRIRLTGRMDGIGTRHFVYALGWPGDSPLRPSYDRVRNEAGWTVHELAGGHNLMRDNPGELLQILLDAAAG